MATTMGSLRLPKALPWTATARSMCPTRATTASNVFYLNILAVAQYLSNAALTVQSTPPTGIVITSSTADGGTTNYTVTGIAAEKSVNVQAPATDPAGYVFSQWTVNGTAQTAGLKSITFAMPAAATVVAQYTALTCTLAVQSTTLTGLSIGSYAGYGGTTNYTVGGIAYGTTVDLEAPDTDSAGDNFVQWVMNGQAYAPGNPYLSFTLSGPTTAAAQYSTLNTSTLFVQSTPPTGLSIGSSTGDGGATDYSVPGVISGSTVNLSAPATDPSGYTFTEWTLNGVAQTAGQKSLTFPAPITWASWGGSGTGDGQFDYPCGIARRQRRQCLCGRHGQPPRPEIHLSRRFCHPVGRRGQRQWAIRIPLRRRGGRERQCLCGRHRELPHPGVHLRRRLRHPVGRRMAPAMGNSNTPKASPSAAPATMCM